MPLEEELLPDPCNDRTLTSVECPRRPNKPLSMERVFPSDSSGNATYAPDTELIKNYQHAGGLLAKDAFMAVCQKAKAVLQRESNLLRVNGKVVIVGDIHGQFYDLLNILRKAKFGKSNKKFVFMGDYVDRGKNQPEVVAYIFGLKVRYPNSIYLLRGNHETRDCTDHYDFRKQMIYYYDEEVYQTCMEMFDQLPVSAVVNGQYLALHGGISERFKSLESINEIKRDQEPPDNCLMNDLIWADPIVGEGATYVGQKENTSRGTSVKFGWPLLEQLLEKENLKTLVRAHEMEEDGFKFHNWLGKNVDPVCITIFSAPNYQKCENDGAVLQVSPNEKSKVRTYYQSEYDMYYLGKYRELNNDNAIATFMPAFFAELEHAIECLLYSAHDLSINMLDSVESDAKADEDDKIKKLKGKRLN